MSDNSWKTPANILTTVGLIISLIVNVIQFKLMQRANNIAEEESTRADSEAQRADFLNKKKDEHLRMLNVQLSDMDRQITVAKDNIQVAELNMNANDPQIRNAAIDRYQTNLQNLALLEQRRETLQKQINDFVSMYR